MAIRGLYDSPQIKTHEIELLFRTGQPDVPEAVGVTLEALKLLGIIEHPDQVAESVTEEFTKLAELGYDGRLHVLPKTDTRFDSILETAEANKPESVMAHYRYHAFWSPGTKPNSYIEEDLNRGPELDVARLAVYNANTSTNVDPVLHFLDTPYDEKYQGDNTTTQLQEIVKVQELFGGKPNHKDFDLSSLDHRAFAMLALMDRIRGVDPKSVEFILNTGFMRIPDFGRKVVGGGSCVGSVDSCDGQLGFDRSDGYARDDFGVGLSVGIK